jgi:hypothetical protein
MQTIRCPTCQRALSLPEPADPGMARCPLCGTTFGVAAPESEQAPAPVDPLVPPLSGVTAEPLTPYARRPPEPDEDYPGGPLTPADRTALQSAVSWLKGAGFLVLLRILSFGICPILVLADRRARTEVPVWVAAGLLVYLVVYLVICLSLLRGADRLNRLSSRVWAVAACSLAAFATLLEVLHALVVGWAILEGTRGGVVSGHMLVMLALGGQALLQGVLIVVFLVASIKAFAALRRPAVWHGFRTSRG